VHAVKSFSEYVYAQTSDSVNQFRVQLMIQKQQRPTIGKKKEKRQ